MKCPGCGSDAPKAASRCPSCSTPLVSSVAIGVLTPLPTDAAVPPAFAREIAEEDLLVTRVSTPPSAYAPTQMAGVHSGRSSDSVDHESTVVVSARTHAGEPVGPLQVGQSFGPRYHIIKQLGIPQREAPRVTNMHRSARRVSSITRAKSSAFKAIVPLEADLP